VGSARDDLTWAREEPTGPEHDDKIQMAPRPNFCILSFILKILTFGPQDGVNLSSVDPEVGAVSYGAEVTCLDAVAYSAEVLPQFHADADVAPTWQLPRYHRPQRRAIMLYIAQRVSSRALVLSLSLYLSLSLLPLPRSPLPPHLSVSTGGEGSGLPRSPLPPHLSVSTGGEGSGKTASLEDDIWGLGGGVREVTCTV
jgi:hypothetical protein